MYLNVYTNIENVRRTVYKHASAYAYAYIYK